MATRPQRCTAVVRARSSGPQRSAGLVARPSGRRACAAPLPARRRGATALARFGQAQRRHRAFDLEGLRVRLARGWRRCDRPAPAACAPAAIPAARSWRPWSSCRPRSSSMTSPNRRCTSAARRRRSRRRGRPRRSGPRARRPGSRRAGRRRRAPRLRTGAAPRAGRAAAPARCRLSSRTRWARTRVRSPSSEPAKRSNSRLETARLRTASPRNSSRSLWSAPKLRCVSARASSAGSAKRWPRRCLQGVQRGHPALVRTRPYLRAALVLDQQEHRRRRARLPCRRRSGSTTLSFSLVSRRSLPPIEAIEYSISFCLLEGRADLRHGAAPLVGDLLDGALDRRSTR